jgi:hypothetical protein
MNSERLACPNPEIVPEDWQAHTARPANSPGAFSVSARNCTTNVRWTDKDGAGRGIGTLRCGSSFLGGTVGTVY